MNWILPLIAGLGIGALLKSLIDHFISRKIEINNRLYEERKIAYIGLLESLHLIAIEPSDKNAKSYALWQARCNVFGSDEVSFYAQCIIDTNDDKKKRHEAFNNLISSMKKDLQA